MVNEWTEIVLEIFTEWEFASWKMIIYRPLVKCMHLLATASILNLGLDFETTLYVWPATEAALPCQR